MLLEWNTTDRWQHTARYDAGPNRSCHLSVERLTDTGWDWTVWCAQDPSIVRHGLARNCAEAIASAEHALPDLNCHCWAAVAQDEGGPASPGLPDRQPA